MRIRTVCPKCKKILIGNTTNEDGKIYLEKRCVEHGRFRDLIWANTDYKYEKAEIVNCIQNCNLCEYHKSGILLGNIDVTMKCNLNCKYCFANAGRGRHVQIEKIRQMMEKLKENNCKAIQITGGEPLMHPEIIEICRIAKEKFSHVQIATNGIIIAKKRSMAVKLKNAGVNTAYLKFDGVTERTNRLIKKMPLIIRNCRRAGLKIVLVPTIINDYNNNEIGRIIAYAIKKKDVIRGINFQPVAFTGRKEYNPKERYTIPDLLNDIEKQTTLKKRDFHTIDTVLPISKLAEALGRKDVIKFTAHYNCGMATYLIKGKEGMIPITKAVNIEEFFKQVEYIADNIKKPGMIKGVIRLLKTINTKEIAEDLKIKRTLLKILLGGKYSDLGRLHDNMILIGVMHFMDCYNLDMARLQKCVIHYITEDLKIIPFCAYNNFYRNI